MHFGDNPLNPEEEVMKVVLYKHLTSTGGEYNMQLASIQECRYISPYAMEKFIHTYNYILDGFDDLEAEHWYLFEVKLDESGFQLEAEVLSITDVSETDNELHRLH